MLERRKNRSRLSAMALRYWLQATVQRLGVEGLVLSDAHGVVVASSLHADRAEKLAAVAPLWSRGSLVRVDSMSRPLQIHEVKVGADEMYLCAWGSPADQPALQQAERGIQRILAD